MKIKTTKALKEESIKALSELLQPKTIVYTSCKHVSSSGMSRELQFFIVKDNKIQNITWYVSHALEYGCSERDGDRVLKVTGCGMDMGFSCVYSLGMTLFPDGTIEPHGTRNGMPDFDGGYALNHSWL